MDTSKAEIPLPRAQGFLDSFVDLYDSFATALEDAEGGRKVSEEEYGYPTVEDGIRSMVFIEAVAQSSKSENKWTPLET